MRKALAAAALLAPLASAQSMEFEISGSVVLEFPMTATITDVTAGEELPLEILAGFESFRCERAEDFEGFVLQQGVSYTLDAPGGAVSLSIEFGPGAEAEPMPDDGDGTLRITADGSGVTFSGKRKLTQMFVGGAPYAGEASLTISVDGKQGYERDFQPATDAIGFNVCPGHEYSFTTTTVDPVILVFEIPHR
jgi:hypothetical protein